jgi:spore maturation protein CgeB
LRIFEVLACEGFVISDDAPAVRAEFDDAVVFTTGDEDLWAKLVRYLSDQSERDRRRSLGRRLILNGHTYAHRMEALVSYLKQLL